MGIGVIGLDADGLAEFSDCFGVITDLGENKAEVIVRGGGARLQANGGLEFGNDFLRIGTSRAEEARQDDVRFRILRIPRDRLLELLDGGIEIGGRRGQVEPGFEHSQRAFQPVLAKEQAGEIDVGIGQVGVEGEGALVETLCCIEVARLGIEHASEVGSIRGGRIQAKRFFELDGGSGFVAAIEERDAEVVAGFGVLRIGIDGLREGRFRCSKVLSSECVVALLEIRVLGRRTLRRRLAQGLSESIVALPQLRIGANGRFEGLNGSGQVAFLP